MKIEAKQRLNQQVSASIDDDIKSLPDAKAQDAIRKLKSVVTLVSVNDDGYDGTAVEVTVRGKSVSSSDDVSSSDPSLHVFKPQDLTKMASIVSGLNCEVIPAEGELVLLIQF